MAKKPTYKRDSWGRFTGTGSPFEATQKDKDFIRAALVSSARFKGKKPPSERAIARDVRRYERSLKRYPYSR